jgi:5-oxoprolinase (ATP-hydrolysing)
VPLETSHVYFYGGYQTTPVFLSTQLIEGARVTGPAIIMQDTATVLVEPGCVCYCNREGDMEIEIQVTLLCTKRVGSLKLGIMRLCC